MDMKQFDLQKFVISIVIIGVILVVGIYISDAIGAVAQDQETSGTVTNETIAWINATTYTVDLSTAEDFAGLSITALFNRTDDTAITLANVTVSGSGFTNATVYNWDNVSVSYTYTYTADTDASNAADDVVDALATGTSWISILVVVGFATIILTMLTKGLGSAASNEAATPYY